MNNYQDFTTGDAFAGLGDFVNELHADNMQYIPIIDAGLAVRKNYTAYQEGLEQNLFIKSPKGDPFVGQVWPDDAVYPDFFNPNTTEWWGKWLTNFHNNVSFDGVWEDMNEASNFCSGPCYQN